MNCRKLAALLLPVLAGASVLLAPASSASAAAPLPCRAWMTNAHPADHHTTGVHVQTVASAAVATVAHYKAVNRRYTATAGAGGAVTVTYYISRATPGYRVTVTVTTHRGNRYGYCSTSFLPHRD